MSSVRANLPDTGLHTSTVSGRTPPHRVKVVGKHLNQSRANEIRARLTAWKQTPESVRPSLRVLARQIGTSHQLLSHCLRGWDKWQAKQYRRQAKEIRTRAEAETRPWVINALLKEADAYDRAAFQCMISFMLEDLLRQTERDVKVGRLKAVQVKMLRLFASKGDERAYSAENPCDPLIAVKHTTQENHSPRVGPIRLVRRWRLGMRHQ